MRPLRVSALLAVSLVLAYGCTDGDGPMAPGGANTAVIGLVASYGDPGAVAGSRQIDSVRVTVVDAQPDTMLHQVTAAVEPGEDSIAVQLEITFPGATLPTVIVTAELLDVEASPTTVAWSTRDTVALGSETTVRMPPLGRGPVENLSVETLAVVAPSGLAVLEGRTLQLDADVTSDDPGVTPTLYWFSLDEAVATVDDQGLVTGVAPGTAPIGVAAGRRADTVEVTVQALAWIDDLGTPLEQGDDDCDFVEFGFTFTFYGQTYSGVWVNSNGNLTFGDCNTTYWNADVPDGSRILIAPLYGDWDPGDGGDVYWNVVGSAGNRTFVATWFEVPEFSNEDGPGTSTFQVQLHEGSNAIVFGYDSLTTDGINWTTSDAGEADMEVGISSGTGSFIRSAVGSEIPGLQGTNLCYAPSDGEYAEVECAQVDAGAVSGRVSGGARTLGTVTPGVAIDPSPDRHRLRKLEERGDPPGHRR